MAGGRLGCGTHTVLVRDRQGGQTVTVLDDVLTVEYGRQLDTHSDASVTVGRNGSCCARLGTIRPWRHELVIFRSEGGRTGEVWSGPIGVPDFGRADTIIPARDSWAWLDRRRVRSTVQAEGDLADVAWALVEHGLLHPGGGLDETGIRQHVDIRRAGRHGRRTWQPDAGYVGSALRELCRGAVNATFLGPRLVLFGETPLSRTATMQDKHFLDEIRVKLDGYAQITAATVRGKGVTVTCGGTDPYYGLLEGEISDESIKDREDARDMACTEVATRKHPPLVLSLPDGAQLSPEAPVTLDQLVPGVLMPVWSRETCLEVNADLIITGVKVVDGRDGEQVNVSLAPGTALDEPPDDFTSEVA